MSKILVASAAVLVSRDAMTQLPTEVPAHEVEILQAAFGKENVTEIDGAKPEPREVDLDTEADRLAGKFGGELLEKAFGKAFEREIVAAAKAAEVKAPKKAAA